MSMPAMTTEEQPTTTGPEVTIEGFLEAAWGIRPGQSRPLIRPVPEPYRYPEGMTEWLYRLWGIGDAR